MASWPTSAHPCAAVGGHGTEPSLGNRSVPCLVWRGRLAESGFDDLLPYPATAGLAPVSHRQIQYRFSRVGAALITRFGTLGRVNEPFSLHWDNGLVFISRDYICSFGLEQEFIAPSLSATEWDDGAGDPHPEGSRRAPALFRQPGAHLAGDR